jgi:Domain of Unknown Function (DUF1080)
LKLKIKLYILFIIFTFILFIFSACSFTSILTKDQFNNEKGNSSSSSSSSLSSSNSTLISWCGFIWNDDGSGSWSVSGNDCIMTGNGGESARYAFTTTSYGNFTFQVDVSKYTGNLNNSIGFWFRGTDASNCYNFNILPDSEFSLWKTVAGNETSIVYWIKNSFINSGLGVWNTLKVTANGTFISIYANGNLLFSSNDSTFSSGKIGLYSYDHSDSPYCVTHFKNASILSLP